MALVLTRRDGQTVRIGRDIVIVVRFDPSRGGRQVKLEIHAPATVKVWRGELIAARALDLERRVNLEAPDA